MTKARQLISGLLLLLFSSLALALPQPVGSPNDPNHYRYIELENGLRAILVSDPEADKAAASLNVRVGSGDDPADREGLAHFLEHMLFLGTEKYPEPGEYQQFIRSHGGSHNAFTAFQNTNYFFDIEPPFLEQALDRFAQQFAAPLFTPELVDRERNAVHSEFSAKQRDDSRRFYSVKKAAANPAHAFSRFAVGNLSTLENSDERPLRPDLVRFWETHYSANLMTLAVYGPQSLDELEAMVRPRFSAIENRQLQPARHDQPLYLPEQLPAKVTAEAIKDIRRMSLSFPIPSQKALYQSKPASYVANLLGHEGPGSLLDVLKRSGLAESLSAGLGMDTGFNATLEINLALTPEGLRKQDEVLALTFDYIDRIRRDGIDEQRFKEMQQLARMNYRFREKSDPLHEAMALASQLQDYPVRDLLRGPWMMERYAPEQYRAILDRLTPDNVMVFVLAPDPLPDGAKVTRWYDTPWQRQPLDPARLQASLPETLASQLRLPGPNPFIPDNLDMVAGTSMPHPVRLGSPGGVQVWYARDTRFGTPKAMVNIGLRSEAVRASARNAVLTRLLVDAINTSLNAWAYPARLAGLNYTVYPHLRGITVRIGGYSDKLHSLAARILTRIAHPELSEQRFRIARQNLIDALENQTRNKPVDQTAEFVQTALLEGAWSTEDKLEAARSITFDELQAFARTLLTQTDPVMLAHGNLTEASALNLAQQVAALLPRHSDTVAVPRSRVRQLPAGETRVSLKADHPDTGYTLYLQGKDTSFAERAAFRLLAQLVSSPFYEELRTRRQLGYIVYATSFEMLETPALGLVVQSPSADPDTIDAAVRDFARIFEDRLGNLDDNSLEREKQAVISRLLQKDRQLLEVTSRYWREIDRQAHQFDSRERLAEAVRALTREDLFRVLRQTLGERQRALLVMTGGKGLERKAALQQLTRQPPVPAAQQAPASL